MYVIAFGNDIEPQELIVPTPDQVNRRAPDSSRCYKGSAPGCSVVARVWSLLLQRGICSYYFSSETKHNEASSSAVIRYYIPFHIWSAHHGPPLRRQN
jgi:hypothetical protein